MKDLERFVMGAVLKNKESTGAEIKLTLEKALKRGFSSTQIYILLNRLKKKKFVNAERTQGRAYSFEATRQGKTALKQSLVAFKKLKMI